MFSSPCDRRGGAWSQNNVSVDNLFEDVEVSDLESSPAMQSSVQSDERRAFINMDTTVHLAVVDAALVAHVKTRQVGDEHSTSELWSDSDGKATTVGATSIQSPWCGMDETWARAAQQSPSSSLSQPEAPWPYQCQQQSFEQQPHAQDSVAHLLEKLRARFMQQHTSAATYERRPTDLRGAQAPLGAPTSMQSATYLGESIRPMQAESPPPILGAPSPSPMLGAPPGLQRPPQMCCQPSLCGSYSQAAAMQNQTLPSAGSSFHCAGRCTPCRFYRSRRGCMDGTDCGLCHFPHMELTTSMIRKVMKEHSIAKRRGGTR